MTDRPLGPSGKDDVAQTRVEALRRLARRQAPNRLARAVAKSSPADIAEALGHLTGAERELLLTTLADPAVGGEVLLDLAGADLEDILARIPLGRLVEWLDAMEPDDEADLIARFPEPLQERILPLLQVGDREEVQELLGYPEDSAGGIMSPVAFRLHEATTCRQAIESLQEQADVEMVFYLYVENEAGGLVGVTSLRNLLVNPPSRRLGEIMTSDVIVVTPHTDQEEVARLASRYDLLAVPVVDDARRLLGIVTIDDVLDVLQEEADEDLLRMAGVGHGAAESALHAVRTRGRWLLVTLFAGLAIAEVVNVFEASLARNAALMGFVPVVMGMSGNVGIQASTISVRNLVTGRTGPSIAAVVWLEVRTGLLMGLAFGGALALWGVLRYPGVQVGLAVGTSIVLSLTFAATMGALVPIGLMRVRVDPAVATGPFVTTIIDFLAVVIYFLVCTRLFGF